MKWWDIRNQGNGTADVKIYGIIADEKWYEEDVTPNEFQQELDALGEISQLNVFINSPGGGVFAGFTIYNILKRHSAKVRTQVDGIAASIASVIVQAGDERVMALNGMQMIHNPVACACGYAEDLRKIADVLDKIAEPIVASYTARTTVNAAKVKEMMAGETWMTASEAVAKGFADSVDKAQFSSVVEDKAGHMIFNGLDFDMSQFHTFDASRVVLTPKASAPPAPAPPPEPPAPPAPPAPKDVDYSKYEATLESTQAVLDQA